MSAQEALYNEFGKFLELGPDNLTIEQWRAFGEISEVLGSLGEGFTETEKEGFRVFSWLASNKLKDTNGTLLESESI